MGKITAITAQKNNKKRANIYMDGEYRCSLDKMTVVSLNLKEGVQVDDEKLYELIADSEEKGAFDSAVKYLCIRMRTENETVRYLKGKKFQDKAIINTIQKLKEYGYLDDAVFCRTYIKTYRSKYGNKKLAYELAGLGIDSVLIERFMEEEGDGEESAAAEAAEKYVRAHRSPIIFNKLASFLYGRGFSAEISRRAAEKYAGIIDEQE